MDVPVGDLLGVDSLARTGDALARAARVHAEIAEMRDSAVRGAP